MSNDTMGVDHAARTPHTPPMTKQQRVMMIAAISGADPRTVQKQLDGKPAHGVVLRQRIEDAARQVDRGEAPISPPRKKV